nr:hypothetical protein [Tanacetum cinerariifolium]
MVNTRTDAELSAAVQNALQTLLPQIRAEIREEFRTSSGPLDSGGNPPSVTIHTWLERFNKQMPRSFEKATAPVDAKNWIFHMEKIFDVMGCEDAFKTRLAVYKFEGNALAWWKAYKQAKSGDAWLITVTWAEFKKLFFLQFFLRAEQERLKMEYHSIRKTNTETSTESTLNHLMYMPFTDVAQVANAARNYEILHERDDDDAERPNKRNSGNGRDQRNRGQQANRSVFSSPWVPLRATPTRSALRMDTDTQESVVKLLVPASTAGTAEEQTKNFQWGLRKSTLNHLMCIPFTNVAQVANAARNYEILHERDDDDAERPDKRQKSGDRHHPTTQQSSHRNHYHNNDRHGSDRRGSDDNHRSNNNYSGNNNRSAGNGRDQRNKGQQSRGPSVGYSYLVCTTCGRRHPGECRRAAGTCF